MDTICNLVAFVKRRWPGLDVTDAVALPLAVAIVILIAALGWAGVIPNVTTWSCGALVAGLTATAAFGIMYIPTLFSQTWDKKCNAATDYIINAAARAPGLAFRAARQGMRWQARSFYPAAGSNLPCAPARATNSICRVAGRQSGASPARRAASGSKSSDDDGGGSGEPPRSRHRRKGLTSAPIGVQS